MTTGRLYKENEYYIDQILELTTKIRTFANSSDANESDLQAIVRQLEQIIGWIEDENYLAPNQKLLADLIHHMSSGKIGR